MKRKRKSTLIINSTNPRHGGRHPSMDKPDFGKGHDEIAERAYMKRQMEARRKLANGDYVAGGKKYKHIDVDSAVDDLMELLSR